jgi:hypothetical protein
MSVLFLTVLRTAAEREINLLHAYRGRVTWQMNRLPLTRQEHGRRNTVVSRPRLNACSRYAAAFASILDPKR